METKDKRGEMYHFIVDNLNAGKSVLVQTALRATEYKKKHAKMFQLRANGVFVQRGKSWDCIDYCKISAY